jgi:hypothetical protein
VQEMLHKTESTVSEAETTPLRLRFWLASGFIPFGPNTKYDVLSMLDPKDLKIPPNDILTKHGISRRLPQHQMITLQKRRASQEIRNSTIALERLAMGSRIANRQERHQDLVRRSPLRQAQVRSRRCHQGSPGPLSFDWHHWGYLISTNDCRYWSHILHPAARLLGTGRKADWRQNANDRSVRDDLMTHVLSFLDGLECGPRETDPLKAIFD